MRKIVVAPDSFKGTLSSRQVCEIIESEILEINPDAEVIKVPMSDGGDGFLDCFMDIPDIKRVEIQSVNSMGEEINSTYLIWNQNKAIIELAETVGIQKSKNNNPMKASTYGVGIQIRDAIKKGIREFIIGIGGSATNDGGVGILEALGVVFLNQSNEVFSPSGGTLNLIDNLILNQMIKGALESNYVIFTDVKNPLLGMSGASHVYSRQKGASDQMVEKLEENMTAYSRFLQNRFGLSTDFEGAGAAGGTNLTMRLFLNGTVLNGIDSYLRMIKFEETIQDADLIISGEGKFDRQSLCGKVIDGISSYSRKKQIPLVAICGQVEDVTQEEYPNGLVEVFSLHQPKNTLEYTLLHTKELIREKVITLLKTY